MKEIIITGHGELSKNFELKLTEAGYSVFILKDPNDLNIHHFANVVAIIDFHNLNSESDDLPLFTHNTSHLTHLLSTASKQNAPFLFLYKWESLANQNHSIHIAIDVINKFRQLSNVKTSLIEVGNLYGRDLVLDDVLRETLYSLTKGQEVFIHDDNLILRPIYITDFIDGLCAIIRETESGIVSNKYSLTPNESITYLEYVHFIKSLTNLNTKIEYDENDLSNVFLTTEFPVYYPQSWKPKVSLEQGLTEILKFYKIPIKQTAKPHSKTTRATNTTEVNDDDLLEKTEELLELQRKLQKRLEENRKKYEELLKKQFKSLENKKQETTSTSEQSNHKNPISENKSATSKWETVTQPTKISNDEYVIKDGNITYVYKETENQTTKPKHIQIISTRDYNKPPTNFVKPTKKYVTPVQSAETKYVKPKENFQTLPYSKKVMEESNNTEYDEFDLYSRASALNAKRFYQENESQKQPDTSIDDIYAFVETTTEEPKDSLSKKRRFTSKKIIVFLSILLVLLLAVPSIITAYNATKAMKHLDNATEAFNELNLSDAKQESIIALTYFDKIDNIPKVVDYIAPISHITSDDLLTMLNIAKTKASIVSDLASSNYLALITDQKTHSNVLGSTTISKDENISRSLSKMNLIQKDLEDIKKNKLLSRYVSELGVDENDVEKLSELYSLSTIWPQLMGIDKPKKYLFVIVDNNELRASGGVVDGYGLLSAENGALNIKQIENPYDINEKLKNSEIVDSPPLPLRNVFRYKQLNFTDATWEPNFADNAKNMAQIIEYTKGETVDGVFLVDTDFMHKLLAITEPVEMPSHATTITTSNFNEELLSNRTEDHSTATFYSELYTRILNNALNKNKWNTYGNNYQSMFYKTIYNSLNQKHMLLFSFDDSVQQVFVKNNWAGTINSAQDDFLYVIDSNISANKIDSFINRKIEYTAYKPNAEHIFKREITLTYTNNSETDEWPLGDYLNHVKIIVPKDAFLDSARLLENGIDKNITRKVIVSPYTNKATYETDLFVEKGKTVVLKITYESAEKYFEDGEVNLYVQKQPGTQKTDLNVKFVFPFGRSNNLLPDGFTSESSHIMKKDYLIQDKVYNIKL